MSEQEKKQTIGEYLLAQRKQRSWSIKELSTRSRVSGGAISMTERGKSIPETETILKMARALELDEFNILRMMSEEKGDHITAPALEPSAAYIARRLTELPEEEREAAIQVVLAVIDNIYNMIERRPLVKEELAQSE